MPTKIHWNEQHIAHITRRIAAGATRAEVAQEYGVSRDTIEKLVKKLRIPVPPRNPPAPAALLARLGQGGQPLPTGHPIALEALALAKRIAFALALACACGPSALAAPPAPGTEDYKLLMPHSEWINGLRRGGVSCCDVSDGRGVEAKIVGDAWFVRFRPEQLPTVPTHWIAVPPEAVLRIANPIGVPLAFWSGGQILCFIPASLY